MRTVIVGCGQIAGGYNEQSESEILTHVLAWRSLGVDIVGCCDIRPEQAEAFASRWGIPQWRTELSLLLADTRPDIVSLCTPAAAQQASVAALVASPSVKAALVEKPLGASARDAEAVARMLVQWARPAIVNYYRAFDPAYQQLAYEAHAGTMGALRRVVACYYGAARTNASHLLERVLATAGPSGEAFRVGARGESPMFIVPFAGGEAVFVPVRDTDYAPLEMDFLFERGRHRMIDSEQRAERYEAVPDPNFPGFVTLGPGVPALAPTFRAFRRPFEALARAACGAPLEVDTIGAGVQVTRILDAVSN